MKFVHGTANSITFVFNGLLPRGDGDGDEMSRNNFDLVVVGVDCHKSHDYFDLAILCFNSPLVMELCLLSKST